MSRGLKVSRRLERLLGRPEKNKIFSLTQLVTAETSQDSNISIETAILIDYNYSNTDKKLLSPYSTESLAVYINSLQLNAME